VANKHKNQVNVFVSVPFPEWAIQRMHEADPRARILYDADLMPKQRYTADRIGEPLEWTDDMERRWREYASVAEVVLGFDRRHLEQLVELAPNLDWIQGTSTGIGPVVNRLGWASKGITVTSARGVHSVPLAEFHLMAMLAFTKDMCHLQALKEQKVFERYNTRQLRGKTLGIIGLGSVGREVARLARAFGVRTLGIKRVYQGASPSTLGVDRLYPAEQLKELVAQCDFLSLTVPGTLETEGLIDYDVLNVMKPDGVLINTARGTVVIQDDLVRALRDGTLRGAALDVFEVEPLPEDSPLWELPNTLLSPHSASCAECEDQAMTDLFIDNLGRYLDGLPLRNVIDPNLEY